MYNFHNLHVVLFVNFEIFMFYTFCIYFLYILYIVRSAARRSAVQNDVTTTNHKLLNQRAACGEASALEQKQQVLKRVTSNKRANEQRGSGAAELWMRNAETGIWNLELGILLAAIRDSQSSLQHWQSSLQRSASYYHR